MAALAMVDTVTLSPHLQFSVNRAKREQPVQTIPDRGSYQGKADAHHTIEIDRLIAGKAQFYSIGRFKEPPMELSGDVLAKNLVYQRVNAKLALVSPKKAGESYGAMRPRRGANAAKASTTGVNASEQNALSEPNTGCEACQNRKYQDGSDDAGVSFQSPQGMPMSTSAITVASHEGEHVTRETEKANDEGKVVTNKQVHIHMTFCTDCGRLYAAGGTTKISTVSTNEGNANVMLQDAQNMMGYAGENIDTYK